LRRKIIDIQAAIQQVMVDDGTDSGESSVLVGIPTTAPLVEEPPPKAGLLSAYWAYKTSTTMQLTRTFLSIVVLVFMTALFLFLEGKRGVLEPYENTILQWMWSFIFVLPLLPLFIYFDIYRGAKKWRAANED
jgi:hypothetical protein